MYRGHIENGVVVFDDEIRLPDGIRVEIKVLEHSGDEGSTWPDGFFDAIRIDDPEFVRPDQGRHRAESL